MLRTYINKYIFLIYKTYFYQKKNNSYALLIVFFTIFINSRNLKKISDLFSRRMCVQFPLINAI